MSDRAALAANWWAVLAVDAAVGLAAVVVGVALAASWWPGWVLAGVGAAYLGLVARRAVRWARLRRAAGIGRRPFSRLRRRR